MFIKRILMKKQRIIMKLLQSTVEQVNVDLDKVSFATKMKTYLVNIKATISKANAMKTPKKNKKQCVIFIIEANLKKIKKREGGRASNIGGSS